MPAKRFVFSFAISPTNKLTNFIYLKNSDWRAPIYYTFKNLLFARQKYVFKIFSVNIL